jgi:hypothetical protein
VWSLPNLIKNQGRADSFQRHTLSPTARNRGRGTSRRTVVAPHHRALTSTAGRQAHTDTHKVRLALARRRLATCALYSPPNQCCQPTCSFWLNNTRARFRRLSSI